jgi:hypothetical protein
MSDEPIAAVTIDAADDSLPKRRSAKKEEAPALTKYEVINGAISPEGGSLESLIHPGSVVELTAEQAKHYNKLGYLKPYLED